MTIEVMTRQTVALMSTEDRTIWRDRRQRYKGHDQDFWALLCYWSGQVDRADADLMLSKVSNSHDAPKKESSTYRDY